MLEEVGMKLLSVHIGGDDRGGILLGEEVLDFTACRELPEVAALAGKRRPTEDALVLFECGVPLLESVVASVLNDPAFAQRLRERRALFPLAGATLLPPVLRPSKILAVGLNYAQHAAEQNAKLPERPLIFSKNSSALTGPDSPIQLPRISEQIDYEAELAVVIGKTAKSVSADHALEYVAGYTMMNDVTARDLQRSERQWARAKGLDTFAPCGPWIVTPEEIGDPHTLGIQLRVNGELRQDSNTSDLIFKIPELIEFISQDLTLLPGDIISTGTPSGVGFARHPPVFLKGGDVVEILIDRIGVLRNRVAAPES